MEEILYIVNSILDEKRLPHINTNDNLSINGFSSVDKLSLLLKLEKNSYNVINISASDITTVENLYYKITNKISDRKII